MKREEAIEVIRKNWPDASFTQLREALETIIPELRESEDERMINEIIHTVTGYHPTHTTEEIEKMVAYLEKQKEQKPLDIPSGGSGAQRTTPPSFKLDVKPAELSEEDERMRNNLIGFLIRLSANTRTDSTSINYSYPREIDWLKSLRPQPHWKPSEEQMAILEIACKYEGVFTQGQLSMLLDLKEQLKKL